MSTGTSNTSSSSSSSSSSSTSSSLELSLGYHFRNRHLLDEALTHPSVASEQNYATNYERLEFLGDSVLGLIIAELLFQRLPHENEGMLTKIKSNLVGTPIVSKIGKLLHLPELLRMSTGENGTGGRENDNNIENAMEAIIGAIFKDSDYETTKTIVTQLWEKDLVYVIDHGIPRTIDAKNIIQQYTQKFKVPDAVYTEHSRSGSQHRPIFEVQLTVPGFAPVIGSGPQLKKAEINAATLFLEQYPNVLDMIK